MSTADIQLSVVFGGQYSFEKLQSDWEQTDPLERDFIKNKPDLVNFEAETVTTETVIFEENPTGAIDQLKLQYNPAEKTIEFGLKDGGVLQLGKEMFEEYTNIDTVALTNGMIVSTAAISGNRKGIKRTDFTNLTSIRSIVGMVTVASIGTNQSGRVTTKGIINDLNTNGIGEGSQLWGNPSVLGGWSGSKPAKPQYAVQIGQVVVAHANVGSVELNVAKDVRFSDLADVNGTTNLIDNTDTIPKRDADGIIREISVADIKADLKSDTDLIYEPLLGFTPENTANKGQANGYASLGADGLVPSNQLPSFVDDVLEFANLAAFPAVGEQGKIYVALDTNKTYRWSGSVYIYINSGGVNSVAGKTGVVTLVKADVGLGNVDNTSDAAKPISTATQTALNGKVNTTDIEQVRSQATNKVASSKLLDDELTAVDDSLIQLADEVNLKEVKTNKQNSLAVDGTGTKYPTVDAVNEGLAGKMDFRKMALLRGSGYLTYNSATGFYEMNGLTDITEEQMMQIYNYTSQSVLLFGDEQFVSAPIRTTYRRPYNGALGTGSFRYAFVGSIIEVYYCPMIIGAANSMFSSCSKLNTVKTLIIGSTLAAHYSNMFYNCTELVNCEIKSINTNLSFQWSPLLTLESLQYLITNRDNGTTPITITVHPTVFAKLTDNVNYPTWYAVNQDALTKYITFASA